MSGSVCAVVPAAGRGTRLGLDVPKIMVEIADGATVWDLLYRALRPSVDHVHVVVAPAAETRFHRLAAAEIARGAVSVSVQREPTGMGDAVFGASGHWESHGGILVVWGDQVNLTRGTVRRVVDAHLRAPGLTIPLVPMPDPYVEYELSGGRLLRVRQSREGDACRPGGLSDVGVFCLGTAGLAAAWRDYLAAASRGAMTGEVNFLPFLAYLSLVRGRDVTAVHVDDPDEARGINTAADLEFARRRHAERAG
ncbi:NTP transferase domain-containing protein [Actinomadura livida]|uniref:Bifunctional UDP-N-acetylglucosamine pyrophosphorylase/glucosamine-1-phosphate N-acetyltransferase n=1 Tax=Actinomadura livida TaxID=79909 RepID=A0A7W7IHT7_9ACTN|nr:MULTISPECIES: NTP transferase domain-containing protein [Actinomadura]MBB4777371.1 bifunctional UDP-N-acetylglucosamine pyrophosphorylase/glucosamine-1-phosphate N-acetyltransferase [Actinomadura catellatispora]GGU19701.1 hypothetical protein GCM10010208_50740 [Actinomadura livida]